VEDARSVMLDLQLSDILKTIDFLGLLINTRGLITKTSYDNLSI